ncbi:MAG: hypothetical protein K6E11_00790 [Bacilli bacterium]|nr:hypothetical protein [Bacilli bacterium]
MWAYPVSLLSYVVVAAIVVFLSIKLSDFVDLLDKKTNLSGALLGSILLAAVTSLPELFTSITATVLIHDNSLVLGNILGSDIFNITLFAIVYIFFFKKLATSKVGKFHLITLMFVGIFYAVTTIASFVFDFRGILWGWFNPMSIAIVIIYAICVWKTPKIEEPDDEEEDASKLTVKQIALLFTLFAILLIGASIGITYLTSWVVDVYGFGSTFGGALFLGVATSLPEMTSTINLCKKKNFNAAYGNILGSCTFNFIILALADALSFNTKTTLYKADQSSFFLLILGGFSLLIALISILMTLSKSFRATIAYRIIFITFGILLIGTYVTFLVLSNIDLGLWFAPYSV